MSLLQQTHRSFLVTRGILSTQKRYSVRERIHRYVEPDKFKKHMLAAAEPYYKRVHVSQEETCKGIPSREYELLPIEKIYIKELLEEVTKSDYTLLIQYNDTLFQSDRVYKNTLTKLGAKFQAYNNRIYREVFKTLGHESTNFMFIARNALITGQVESLPNCIKALKRMPQYIVLGGFVDNHLFDVDMLNAMAISTDLDQTRANLVGTLETPSIELASLIERWGESVQSNGDNNKSE